MAKPAFIYALDNLGPYQFTQLCGELLGRRYNGFLLGGEGADGGIDAEIDKILGILHPQTQTPLLNKIIQPDQIVVFQFKHKVTARVGQSQSRDQILSLYKCNTKSGKVCELHKDLVQSKKPITYVLVTNVEVNSQFRERFINLCQKENPNITNYQIIGLDDLVSWIEILPELRHLYFPTIFDLPRYNLRITLEFVYPMNANQKIGKEVLAIGVLNVGIVPSYLGTTPFEIVCIINGERQSFWPSYQDNPILNLYNPTSGEALQPGKKQTYFFSSFSDNYLVFTKGREIFPIEIQVRDEIDNIYNLQLDDSDREELLKFMSNENT